MKLLRTLIATSIIFTLGSCSKFRVNRNSDMNMDSDPISSITSDNSETNEFDTDFTEEEIEVPETYDTFSDNEIKKAGKYYLKGELGNIVISAKESKVYLFFDGVTLDSSSGIALEGSKKTTNVYIHLLNNSENKITNDFEDTNAVHIKGSVQLSGSGSLTIESKQKNGFKVGGDLRIFGSGVTLNVTGANHAIAARSIAAKEATINVVSKAKDGIQLECDSDIVEYTKDQGFANFSDVKFTADTYGDGIQAETYIYVSGGEMNIVTHGQFVSYSTTNMETYELETTDFKFVQSGNSYKRVATDEIRNLNSSYYALINSVKGLKAGFIENDTNDDGSDEEITTGDYEIYIAHLAKIAVNSTDDCIHTNYGKVTIDSSNLVLDTFDDGVHADYNLLVNNASIQINSSYEGLEGANVTIDGANTNIVITSSDDGINAASDLVKETNIYIKNGYLRIYASGDGVDANTALYFQGGTTIVEGPGSGNGSVDSEKIYFQGGIVFACSTSGMKESMSATQYTFFYQGNTMSQNQMISIVGDDDESIFSYTLKQSCNQLFFSHPSLTKGSTYRIVEGEENVIASIQLTSTLTTVGSSGQVGGGGPRQ